MFALRIENVECFQLFCYLIKQNSYVNEHSFQATQIGKVSKINAEKNTVLETVDEIQC